MPFIHISNGRIDNISTEGDTSFVTVTYRDRSDNRGGNRRNEQTVRMVVNSRTIVLNENAAPIRPSRLRVGMIVNAIISSVMTRSIPPQSVAFIIEIVERTQPDSITTGRILDVDGNNRSFTTISDRDVSSIIRFNVPEDAVITDRSGRPINFSRLNAGMRVRVRHANFMTASIPPQTTAFEVRVL